VKIGDVFTNTTLAATVVRKGGSSDMNQVLKCRESTTPMMMSHFQVPSVETSPLTPTWSFLMKPNENMMSEAKRVLQKTITRGGELLEEMKILALDTMDIDSIRSSTTRWRAAGCWDSRSVTIRSLPSD
jgi:hypothetical protein